MKMITKDGVVGLIAERVTRREELVQQKQSLLRVKFHISLLMLFMGDITRAGDYGCHILHG